MYFKEEIKLKKQKIKNEKEKQKRYLGYRSGIEFAIETLPDKELKEAIKECNRYGLGVEGFFTTLDISELASIAVRITKENEKRIFSILKNIENEKYVNIVLSYDERYNMELIRIFANLLNKENIFKIVKDSVKKKINFESLTLQLQEIYKMHRALTKEDMDHQIKYNAGRLFQSTTIKNIESYFTYGADRINKIYGSILRESTDSMNNKNYNYRFRDKKMMLNKMKQINCELEKEFKWQEDEFEALCMKYRRNPNDEDADMFVRLAKVRDEYEV